MSRRNAQLNTVRTEGGLLPQDVLSRIQAGDQDLPGLTPESYHLAPHERIGEAVNRAWSRLTAAWRAFREALAKEPDAAKATGVTRDRWLLPLFEELKYGRLPKGQAIDVEGKSYAVSHTWHRSPIHLLGAGVDLDRRQPGVAGAAKASPHGLVQEFLNRSEDHLWGFVSNGLVLRILRDHHSLTRQAYVEFDLEAIMEGEQYSEFLLLWMVCHQSRVEADQPEACWLERWFNTSREQGIRALDKLRLGVEKAIEALGTGFLAHRTNTKLCAMLESGELDKQDYYRQLLRLVYRLIFLFVAEERDALLDPDADEIAKNRYLRFYATRRLRELSNKRRGGPHGDLWQSLRLVMSKLDAGCPELALPALGSLLWSPTACPALMDAECSNEHVLDAVRHISTLEEGRTRYPVNWRNVGADELGSIYEALLERHPRINRDAPTFVLDTAPGHERKTTGSYYTPTELVDCLLDSALDPVLDEAAHKPNAEAAILDLKVCDPACGSGHFLVAAARRIAKRLAAVRADEDEPSPLEVQRALRDVVGRCIYGVDVNPMAVELCKVSLWMEAIEPGRPLSFLDSHIQCGNALLGATPALMARGIPDDAFKPIEGDDKKRATALKKRNRKERKNAQRTLAFPATLDIKVVDEFLACDQSPDYDLAAVREHERCWANLQRANTYRDAQFRADAWCASFVWPKDPGETGDAAITEEVWRRLQLDASTAGAVARRTVREISRQYRFFHWHLAFPQVFGEPKEEIEEDDTTGWTGGFNVVLGNPPWERINLQAKEFFAMRSSEIANAKNAAARKRAIAKLKAADPVLWSEWQAALRQASGESILVRDSGRYPLCGRGDVNTYSIFAELNRTTIGGSGRVGCILPSGIAMDATTQHYFRDLVQTRTLASLYHFENEDRIFPGVHHAFRFCLVTISGSERPVRAARYSAYARSVAVLQDPDRTYELTAQDFERLNPNSQTFPAFRSRRDTEITKAIYRRVPVLVRETTDDRPEVNPWGVTLKRMLHMADDSGVFRTEDQLRAAGWQLRGNVFERDKDRMMPLYEAKMVHHFDHRFSTYDGQTEAQARQGKLPELTEEQHTDPHVSLLPRYWAPEAEVDQRLDGRWDRGWLVSWRDITGSEKKRTVIATTIPRGAVGHTMPLFMIGSPHESLAAHVVANMSSFVLDFASRQKIGGTHLTYGVLNQLPVLPPTAYREPCPWCAGSLADWLGPRALELAYTAWELEPFARDQGYAGAPFRWNNSRRHMLACELDAAFFHLYGVDSTDVEHVMDSFWVVHAQDVREHGEYRTKRIILEIHDQMRRAIDTGTPYETLLDPPPAAPGASHATYAPDGTPKDYAEALRTGLLFALIRRSGAAGLSLRTLSRALLWLQDSKHASTWFEGSSLEDFERVRAADSLLADGSADSHANKLLGALENEGAITLDPAGVARLREGGSIPNWLPQTPALAKLAILMRGPLERAEQGQPSGDIDEVATGKVSQA